MLDQEWKCMVFNQNKRKWGPLCHDYLRRNAYKLLLAIKELCFAWHKILML